MRLRSSHLLILAAIVLLLLVVAGFLQTRKWDQAREDRATATTKQVRAGQPGALGRERCKQKCSSIHKGYVYRARQDLDSAGSSHVEPEYCGCV